MNFIEQVKKSRSIAAPIVVIHTPDQIATANKLSTVTMLRDDDGSELQEAPVIQWDLIAGMRAVGCDDTTDGEIIVQRGEQWLTQLAQEKDCEYDGEEDPTQQDPLVFLDIARRFGVENQVFILHSADGCIDSMGFAVLQAILNVRDDFKATGRTLFLLGPDVQVGAMLSPHVIELSEPLPTGDDLFEIAETVWRDTSESRVENDLPAIPSPDREKMIEAMTGLVAFPAENAAAMSLTEDGFDLEVLWHEKHRKINETQGLSVYSGVEKFDDLGGLDRAKEFLTLLINGKTHYSLVVFIDEIEKAMAGSGNDSSGVSQGLLQQELSYMQDRCVRGLLFLGHPGAGKSAIAKAVGNEAGVPCIEYDLNGLKGELVGQTERHQRAAHKTFDAVAGGSILYVATCNGVDELPPALRRRFNRGTFFFDTPTQEERLVIWEIYCTKHDVDVSTSTVVNDEGWTGAEIQQCVEIAEELQCSLEKAATYVIPIARSAPETVENLCVEAHGKFQAASSAQADKFGAYKYTPPSKTSKKKKTSSHRSVSL